GMPGKFNIANAALAATMVFTGHDRAEWDTITAALQNTEKSPFDSSVPGRMEVIADQPTVIVDFAHNPHGLTQALKPVKHARAQPYDPGPTIIILGAAGQPDTAQRQLMGRITAQHADIVIVSGDGPHGEDRATVRNAVVDGARAYAASCTNGPEV